jgi:phytoene synthase
VLAADEIYGAIGEKVFALGERAWDQRVRVGSAGKLGLLGLAMLRSVGTPSEFQRDELWTRPRQS